MCISYVQLNNFRNFEKTGVSLKKHINTFYGSNGSGKTNFVESLLIITRGKSFRKIKREDLIKYNSKTAIIKANIQTDTVTVIIEKDFKKVVVNDKQIHKNKRYLETFFINSDLLFYFKNFSHFRIKLIDKLCYNIFGSDFYINYKKYINAIRNYKNEPYNKIWLKIFKNYQEIVNAYRIDFFKRIKDDYGEAKEKLKLSDCLINFKGDEKKELNIIRKDKKDLSLGELKAIIVAILYSTIKIKEDKNVILILDDYNSEWDENKQQQVKSLISELSIQCFIMETQRANDTNFIIEKGEIKKV